MKDAQFTLEFTTHVLANSSHTENNHDVFQKDANGRIILQQSWFYSAFTKAIELANIKNVKPSDISMDLTIDAPTQLYERTYSIQQKRPLYSNSKRFTKAEEQVRTHEAIFPGTKVTFRAVVADHITENILTTILDRMGKFVGFSPYGHKLGFGRFNVVKVTVAPSVQ